LSLGGQKFIYGFPYKYLIAFSSHKLYRVSPIKLFIRAHERVVAAAAAHGAIKAYFLVLTTCTRVHIVLLHSYIQTVPLNPYSCTSGMTPSVQMYTPNGSTRTHVQPASLQMYSCARGSMRPRHNARLCSTHHLRCTTVCTVLPGVCAGSGLTFLNHEFRVKVMPVICRFGPPVISVRVRGLNVQPEVVSM
jgi:hypothetical protein